MSMNKVKQSMGQLFYLWGAILKYTNPANNEILILNIL